MPHRERPWNAIEREARIVREISVFSSRRFQGYRRLISTTWWESNAKASVSLTDGTEGIQLEERLLSYTRNRALMTRSAWLCCFAVRLPKIRWGLVLQLVRLIMSCREC
jgi:hypothetical protein